MLLIYRYVGRFGPDLVHQLVPHWKKCFYFMVTMREIQTFITNISYKVFKKLLHYSCCNKTTNHSRQTSSNTQKLHL